MKKPTPPCRGCQERSAECHAICEKYKQYEKDKKAFHKVVLEEAIHSNMVGQAQWLQYHKTHKGNQW